MGNFPRFCPKVITSDDWSWVKISFWIFAFHNHWSMYEKTAKHDYAVLFLTNDDKASIQFFLRWWLFWVFAESKKTKHGDSLSK